MAQTVEARLSALEAEIWDLKTRAAKKGKAEAGKARHALSRLGSIEDQVAELEVLVNDLARRIAQPKPEEPDAVGGSPRANGSESIRVGAAPLPPKRVGT